ncbi:polynucleotide adenylyltransferase PcnB [Cellvibrio fibrivorans]|uniref:Poly(A) polymerase I n=1 Tax=Cellvibrio fibrivorans TaxID=126350 RepID=A0ABU1USN9_9GAMM|nr:polynucleotide adenylyltransferase PcnB [Cellvibrio fibrivorans]MDR7088203.1 poly(A) polymerase [Cellvibrio fibrivorans]
MLKRLLNLFTSGAKDSSKESSIRNSDGATLIPRDQHSISRKNISPAAIKIIKQLEEAGFAAYLVGGGVRDLLLGNHPKDFDVATNAKPEEVKRIFRSARIVGRRFQIVHVRMGREVIEVTTFRGHHEESSSVRSEDGMLLRDNVYGTLETDAMRRDFTVNALYYTLKDFSVIDYCNGMEDLKQRTLRIIGDPATRYKEDPVRILRALRFAAKLGFNLEPKTAKPIRELSGLLLNVSDARLFEEVLKLFLGGSATATFNLMREYDLLAHLFPGTDIALKAGDEIGANLIEQCMINTDKRIRSDKTVTPAFIYAALLWPALQQQFTLLSSQMTPTQAWAQAAQNVINQQLTRTAVPKRFLIPMREIWDLQQRLPSRLGMRALRTLDHPRFRAAYDFLLMREAAGEALDGLGVWWTNYQTANDEEREQMVKDIGKHGGTKAAGKPRRRRGPRKPKTDAAPGGNE